VTTIKEAVGIVRKNMLAACRRSGRSMEDVKLVAVTKRVDAQLVREALALGIRDLGENYVQEARQKIEAIGPGPTWHMIGHVQTNKAKYIPGSFAFVHSVDRWELLEALDRFGRELFVLFEVNIAGEIQKHGTTAAGLKSMLNRTGELHHVKPVGLMTMPPYNEDPEQSRPIFRALRELLADVNKEFGIPLRELSMGMSSDFEVAIEEGATMVRVGTAIFGERS
jgi:pyridoxal phosphate enzyme (YggS family)